MLCSALASSLFSFSSIGSTTTPHTRDNMCGGTDPFSANGAVASVNTTCPASHFLNTDALVAISGKSLLEDGAPLGRREDFHLKKSDARHDRFLTVLGQALGDINEERSFQCGPLGDVRVPIGSSPITRYCPFGA